jgi:hypothetical protein
MLPTEKPKKKSSSVYDIESQNTNQESSIQNHNEKKDNTISKENIPKKNMVKNSYGELEEKGKERKRINISEEETESEKNTDISTKDIEADYQSQQAEEDESDQDKNIENKNRVLHDTSSLANFFRGWNVSSAWNALTLAGISIPGIPALITNFYSPNASSVLTTASLMSAVLNLAPGHYQTWWNIKKLEKSNHALAQDIQVTRKTSFATFPLVNHLGFGFLLLADTLSLTALAVQTILFNVSKNKDDIEDTLVDASLANYAFALSFLIVAHPTIGIWMTTTKKNLEKENKELKDLDLLRKQILIQIYLINAQLEALENDSDLLSQNVYEKKIEKLKLELEVLYELKNSNKEYSYIKWLKKIETTKTVLNELTEKIRPLALEVHDSTVSQIKKERKDTKEKIQVLERKINKKEHALKAQKNTTINIANIALSEKFDKYNLHIQIINPKKRSFVLAINTDTVLSEDEINLIATEIKNILAIAFPQIGMEEINAKNQEKEQERPTILYLKLSANEQESIKKIRKCLKLTIKAQAPGLEAERNIVSRMSDSVSSIGLFAAKSNSQAIEDIPAELKPSSSLRLGKDKD